MRYLRGQSSQLASRVGVHGYSRRGMPASMGCSMAHPVLVRPSVGPAATHASNRLPAVSTVISSP